MELKIRNGRLEDLEACFILEGKTFPEEEAACRKNIEIRLKKFSEGFIVGELDGEIVTHINSGSTNKEDITDEEFMNLAEEEGNVYSLEGFQEAFNNSDVNTEIDIVRFINLPLND